MSRDFLVLGVSHQTAPLEVRERLAVDRTTRDAQLAELVEEGRLGEGVLLSTCNRVELIATAKDVAQAGERAQRYFAERAGIGRLDSYMYQHAGSQAVRHLFRVSSGLDSMVLGEPQILGQVKDAWQAAQDVGTLGSLLGRCFDHAFAVAKRVRSETGVASGQVSVSSIACDLAEQIFGDLAQRRVVLLGAGEMSEAAARSLQARGALVLVLNRSQQRAEHLAREIGGTARPLEALASELAEADVVLSSTSTSSFVITHELMQDVAKARRWRPIFLIDIAVPRDVDPRADMLENVFLYDIDDLQSVADQNLAARRGELQSAEQIVEAEVERFELWRRSLQLTPTIVALREHFRDVMRSELEFTCPRLSQLTEEDQRALERMADAMVNKLLHQPIARLKQSAERDDGAAMIELARSLFPLERAVSAEPLAESGPAHPRAQLKPRGSES